jgi:hypothetical protein
MDSSGPVCFLQAGLFLLQPYWRNGTSTDCCSKLRFRIALEIVMNNSYHLALRPKVNA